MSLQNHNAWQILGAWHRNYSLSRLIFQRADLNREIAHDRDEWRRSGIWERNWEEETKFYGKWNIFKPFNSRFARITRTFKRIHDRNLLPLCPGQAQTNSKYSLWWVDFVYQTPRTYCKREAKIICCRLFQRRPETVQPKTLRVGQCFLAAHRFSNHRFALFPVGRASRSLLGYLLGIAASPTDSHACFRRQKYGESHCASQRLYHRRFTLRVHMYGPESAR